jgi:hypothetical protein
MKINLVSFNCQFDEGTEKVALFCISDLKQFLTENNLSLRDFNPDFVNEKMNEFVFCVDNKEWKEFVSRFYAACETKIVLHDMPAPDDFDIYTYFSCNIYIIEYIINPGYRDKAFLMQATENIGNEYFVKMMHAALSDSKKFKINSLYKLKMYWNTLRYDGNLGHFQSHRQLILKKLSSWFPDFYRLIYDKWVCDNKFFSDRFRSDYLSASEMLLQRLWKGIDYETIDFPF